MRRGFAWPRIILLVTILMSWGVAWSSPPVLALDLFGSSKSRQPVQGQSPEMEQFPSFAEVAKRAMPAVVNISTTQKPTRRRGPFPFPQPGPNPFGDDPFEEFFRVAGENGPSRSPSKNSLSNEQTPTLATQAKPTGAWPLLV